MKAESLITFMFRPEFMRESPLRFMVSRRIQPLNVAALHESLIPLRETASQEHR
jgi:hypothetical protein